MKPARKPSAPNRRLANRDTATTGTVSPNPDAAPKGTTTPSGAMPLEKQLDLLNRWRQQYNPLVGLGLQRAVQLSLDYFRGVMADVQWTYFYIEQTDPDLLALVDLRLSRIMEMAWNFKPKKGADAGLAAEQQEALSEAAAKIDNLYDAVEHLALAAFRGYAHAEKWLDPSGDLFHLEIVDQWNVVRDGLFGCWKYNPAAMTTFYGALPGDSIMPAENFLFRQVRRPINRIALLKFIRSNLCEKDWDAFVEIYGIPGGVVIGPPDVPDPMRLEFEAAAQNVAQGGTGFLPNGSDWKPNVAARGMQPYKERLDHLTEKLVLVGTGGKLTMLAASAGMGGGNQGKTHDEVFQSLAAAEARRISAIFQRQIFGPILEAKFPGQPQVVAFELAHDEEVDVSATIADIKMLSDAGFQVDPSKVQEKTGYAVMIKAPAPVAPGQPGDDLAASAPASGDSPAQPAEPADVSDAADPEDEEEGDEPPGKIANRAAAAAAGREAVFAASAQAKQLAAKRAIFRPLAQRVSALLSASEADFPAMVAKLQADSAHLHAAIVKESPALAAPTEQIIGTALASGYAEAAVERPRPSRIRNSPRNGYHDLRDELGRFAPGDGSEPDPDRNEQLGRKALDIAARRKGDVKSAMFRPGPGTIDFVQGTPGNPSKDFAGGHGLTHIAAKHPKALANLPTVLARGTVGPNPAHPDRFLVTHPLGVASLAPSGRGRSSIVTSYEPS